MPLGTRDLLIIAGDLVRLTSHRAGKKHSIPVGTIAPISRIIRGAINKYELEGYGDILFHESDIELVSYVRTEHPCCLMATSNSSKLTQDNFTI